MTKRHLWVVANENYVLRMVTAGLIVVFALLSASARADYPSPQKAGFHHCALIYNTANRGIRELSPFVARFESGKAKEWLFDAFLFLVLVSRVYYAPRY